MVEERCKPGGGGRQVRQAPLLAFGGTLPLLVASSAAESPSGHSLRREGGVGRTVGQREVAASCSMGQ